MMLQGITIEYIAPGLMVNGATNYLRTKPAKLIQKAIKMEILILYAVVTYLFSGGIIFIDDSRQDFTTVLYFIFSPVTVPVVLGMIYASHQEKK